MLIFLALQSLVFAAWVVISFGILLGLFGRAMGRDPGLPGPAAQVGIVQDYMSDPMTRLRRRLWVGLTVLLLACSVGTGFIFATL
ncbi:hypothetical protein [Jannaschia marina]|uniref:hypothetical protein n=1 Tax=Jannaschia marina TaxID=2741674 RepID=UPI0015CC707B|nr:hypothetical protein [Jannaschia marina]